MNYGGDAAEQIVRFSLEGMEALLRITGQGTRELAILIAAALKAEQKTAGKGRLTNMLKSGKELTVFSLPQKDLKKFVKEAKKYGVLYSVIKEKNSKDENGIVDIITRAEDAPKINRVVERFKLASVDKAQIVRAAEKSRETNDYMDKIDKLLDEVTSVPGLARREVSNQSELFSDGQKKAKNITDSNVKKVKKPSVRAELKDIKEKLEKSTAIARARTEKQIGKER